ncbi:hypothetical protein PRIPAC_85651 [Pristionchus pacificus]|uniref:F-box domain-containing protein n=1 Tax=Pristionchus pacificus TaxID=54126 RepID=A0A2A6BSE8_PRIPA|nr:hypothetical protein PRIPAC_85651 [Pristionchus pacificus]|eukprot:PDM68882.1 F-box domain-containing protein [Pristionchus pacificus]
MDLLALPDVFLRMLMRKMTIKDRLRLRLTCRALERLVADSHAGFFPYLFLGSHEMDGWIDLIIHIDNARFKRVELDREDKVEAFIHMRHRLFSGISIGYFEMKNHNDNRALDFAIKLLDNFEIKRLCTGASYEEDLENKLQHMSHFPLCKYQLTLGFLPESAKLPAFPAMDVLSISSNYTREIRAIPAQTLFRLMNAHRQLYIRDHYVCLSADDVKSVVKILSHDKREREIRFDVEHSTITKCLRNYGFSESSVTGEVRGSFEVGKCSKSGGDMNVVELRIFDCSILFSEFSWMGKRRVVGGGRMLNENITLRNKAIALKTTDSIGN